MRRFGIIVGAIVVAAFPMTLGIAWFRVAVDGNTPSKVIGTVAHGRIDHAHVIPPWGPGYVTYSFLGSALGRQYVDDRVRDALLATFSIRAKSARAPYRESHHRPGVRAAPTGDAIGAPAGNLVGPHHPQAGLGTTRRAFHIDFEDAAAPASGEGSQRGSNHLRSPHQDSSI